MSQRAPKPEWLRVTLRTDKPFQETRALVKDLRLHTVCQEARCPNMFECWGNRTATFMILGDICTRRCAFCAVATGRPGAIDPGEPDRVGQGVASLGIRHAVITSVDRDDLPDGGASHFAETIQAIRRHSPETRVEVLIPDFNGDSGALAVVMKARPEVLAHNVETVPRLYRTVRPRAKYQQSLTLLKRASAWRSEYPVRIKSGLMVGLGETREELFAVFQDLREHECDILTVGQYLRPTEKHHEVIRYYPPEEFVEIRTEAKTLGFTHVESGPLVRSSYHAHLHVADSPSS
ncbi:MAG: lipoyl synthase [Armatimonadetes bacterium]|nr:lipoyl synthase [Armatimonadota bacterium]